MLSLWRRAGGRVRVAVVGVTLLALVIAATGALALFTATPAIGAQSTLTVLAGAVTVREGAGAFADAADGQTIGPGVTVRTGPDSHAVLTYVDGTTVTIEPDSEVTIEALEITASGDLVAIVQQTVGRTWHVVQHRSGPDGRYEVRTPAAVASVRGTAFTVDVDGTGATDVETTEGLVGASGDDTSVDVGAGEVTTVSPDAAPQAPRPAPAPQAIVRIVLEPTNNAVAVDASGRAVGLQNGIPLRYAPGSKVEIIDGQLVLIVPTNDPGRISTVVQRDDRNDQREVEIRTEVISRGSVVSDTRERRGVDNNGVAKGGVVLTTEGVIVLPDNEAQRFGSPIIGVGPDGTPGKKATPLPRPSASPRARTDPPGVAVAASRGGFQPFQSGGTGSFVNFTGDVPGGLLPPPPASKEGCTAFAADCRGRAAVAAREQPPTTNAQQTFIDRGIAIPAGAQAVFDRIQAADPGRGSRGCRETALGIVCGVRGEPQGTPAGQDSTPPLAPAGSSPSPDPSPSARPAGSGAGAPGGGGAGAPGGGGGPPPGRGGFVPPPLPLAVPPLGGNPASPPPGPVCAPPQQLVGGTCVAPNAKTTAPASCPPNTTGTPPNCVRRSEPTKTPRVNPRNDDGDKDKGKGKDKGGGGGGGNSNGGGNNRP
ncbi:MAG: FecR family protein [Dehalococcoidia bacterium]